MNALQTAMGKTGMARRVALRELVYRAQTAIERLPGSRGPDPFPLKHTFADGVYLRQIFIPKGYWIVGKVHRTRHAVFVSVGDVSVLSEFGLERIRGPAIFVSEPGTKRVVFAHADTLWTNVHATTETDLEKIEAQVIEPELLEAA